MSVAVGEVVERVRECIRHALAGVVGARKHAEELPAPEAEDARARLEEISGRLVDLSAELNALTPGNRRGCHVRTREEMRALLAPGQSEEELGRLMDIINRQHRRDDQRAEVPRG